MNKFGPDEYNSGHEDALRAWVADKDATLPDELLLAGVHLSNLDLSGAKMARANLKGATLVSCVMHGVDLSSADMYAVKMFGCDLGPQVFHTGRNEYGTVELVAYSTLVGANASGASISRCRLDGANLDRLNLGSATVDSSSMRLCRLVKSNLNGSVLRSVDLSGAVLYGCTMMGAIVDRSRLDRIAVVSLGPESGITPGMLSRAILLDDSVDLRAAFSGLPAFVHGCALFAFVMPYVYLVVSRWVMADIGSAKDSEKAELFLVLLRYIVSGGQSTSSWAASWLFGLFVASCAYNCLRFVLLVKASSLSRREKITGVPPFFSFSDAIWGRVSWRHVHVATWVGFYVNLVVVAVHTVSLLSRKVPV